MADIPKIRFKGFTEPWEQRKLSDVTACIKNGYTYKADGSRDHRYKITRIESISSGVINTEKLGSSDEINENYRLVDGDILFSHINSLPYIANTALYTADLGEIYHGMNLLNIRSRHEEIDSHFLLHLLKKESTRDWFRIIAKPAVNQASISTTEVGAFAFLIPRMEEQKKISSVLDNLDNLITLHQRKCDDTKELKKYMLQKMFPKNGEKFPEIRFKGFTEAWEQRKLEAVLSLLKDGTHGTHQDAEEGPYLLSAKNIKNGQIIIDDSSDRKISEDEFNQIHTKFTLENGDILLTIVGSIGESAILESAGKFTFQRSVAFLRPSEEMTSRFLKTEIESVQFQKELNDRKSQSAQPGVYLGDLSKIPIYITSKEEQKKIGKYFSHLDNLITLHQRKCDTLKELKKYMLQNMFPKKG